MIDRAYGLSTDLYEITMAAAYFENRVNHDAIFELFVRSFPKRRSYLIAAGLEQSLEYLRELRFTSDQVDYLRAHPALAKVSPDFFDYLKEFRFTGDVWAMPEGTAAFPMEPMIRVAAPIIEAQMVETFLLATVNFQTSIASKAARVVSAAQGRSAIEFGTRRAHGTEAGLFAARAAYIGGCVGTSNVEAGFLFGIPIFGTLAHSFVMSFEEEDEAFRAFLKVFPANATVLVDTYDTIAAVKRLARDYGPMIPAVRLDSGDFLQLSKQVRHILDEAGMFETIIFASGDLDEYRIQELLSEGAPINAFGVGTQLSTSYDAPALGGVYKLVALSQNGRISLRMKLSPQKATYPGAKQVWRLTDGENKYACDVITMADEDQPQAVNQTSNGTWTRLLSPVMIAGKPVDERGNEISSVERDPAADREWRLAKLNQARARASQELKRLPDDLLVLDSTSKYPVIFSERLEEERQKLLDEIAVRGARQ